MALAVTSCSSDDAVAPTVEVTADFTLYSATIPSSYMVSIDGATAVEAQVATPYRQTPIAEGSHTLLGYTLHDAVSVSGTVASIAVDKSRLPEATSCFYGAYATFDMAESGVVPVVLSMRQYWVRRVAVRLYVASGDVSRIKSATCTLDGVVTAIDLATGKTTGNSYMVDDITVGNDELSSVFYILGAAEGESQTVTVTITYTDGEQDTFEQDYSSTIGSDQPCVIEGELSLPIEAGVAATISGWKQVDDSFTAK